MAWRWFHQTYTVATIFAGGCEWAYRGAAHRAGPGSLMLREPGEVHVEQPPRPSATFATVFLDPSVVERAMRESSSGPAAPHLVRAQVSDPVLFDAFTRLHGALETSATRLERQSRLAACVQLLLGRHAERGPTGGAEGRERAAVRRVREYLHERYADNVSLDELAAIAGLGRFTLATAFRREVGLPPHAYHLQVRVAAARRLLAGGMSAVRVATTVGFADQAHMIRHFRRAIGITPGAYADAARGRESPMPQAGSIPALLAG
ncbi:MAG TPA: AraC family transcriptional regulator [Thermodesulfobacteriota bacterium]